MKILLDTNILLRLTQVTCAEHTRARSADDRGIYGNWQSLVVSHKVLGKTAHDARLVAAMQRHELSNLLTFNGVDFARFASTRVFSPADVLAGRLPQSTQPSERITEE